MDNNFFLDKLEKKNFLIEKKERFRVISISSIGFGKHYRK
jgi:hypothetical protein